MNYPILKYFEYRHLPPDLQRVSAPICGLANTLAATLPPGPEVSAALRKLLEAKDCAVRAQLGQVHKPADQLDSSLGK